MTNFHALAQPEPVPVAERLPTAADCDAEGQVWAWRWYDPEADDNGDFWVLVSAEWLARSIRWTHWLPANALPLPRKLSLR